MIGKKRDRKWSEKCLNPDCDEIHPLVKCAKTSEELKTKLLEEYRAAKRKRKLGSAKVHNRGIQT